ncbi:hypothetical protein Tco_0703276 [Tanacetum coccineum]|uniref:Uncharacterized protein n=1 Tax=Tanacetum coccineum TaxID=301880 RepID=A0ABQ4Y061_9ASTR
MRRNLLTSFRGGRLIAGFTVLLSDWQEIVSMGVSSDAGGEDIAKQSFGQPLNLDLAGTGTGSGIVILAAIRLCRVRLVWWPQESSVSNGSVLTSADGWLEVVW